MVPPYECYQSIPNTCVSKCIISRDMNGVFLQFTLFRREHHEIALDHSSLSLRH